MGIVSGDSIKAKHIQQAGADAAKIAYELVKLDMATSDYSVDFDDLQKADKFEDSNGYMNTINTSSTVCYYDDKNKAYTSSEGLTDLSSETWTHSGVGNSQNAYDRNLSTYAHKSWYEYGASSYMQVEFSSPRDVVAIRIKARTTCDDTRNLDIRLYKKQSGSWIEQQHWGAISTSVTADAIIYLGETIEGLKVTMDNESDIRAHHNHYYYEIGILELAEGKVVTNELFSNTNGFEGIYVYTVSDIPTPATIKVDVSLDGGSTWAVTNADLGFIDLSDYSGNALVLRFKLNSTDVANVPKLYGYGVKVWTK